MSLATAELPADPAALRAFALALPGRAEGGADSRCSCKALEIEKLQFQIAKLRRMQFGRSSERITRQIEQLELQLEELETGEAEDAARAEAERTLGSYTGARKAEAQAAARPSAAAGGCASARR